MKIYFVKHASDELQRWDINGQVTAKYLEQVESKILKGTNKNDTHHHENNPTHNATHNLGKIILPQLEDCSQSIQFWENSFLSRLE